MREDRKRISPTFDIETYKKIKAIAHKEEKDMSDVVRDWAIQGLNGTLVESNLEVLAPIIREQLKVVLEPMLERMISLEAKTCIQSGTAAYLAADAILKFVPPTQREDVQESYEKARRQSIQYMKTKVHLDE